MHVIKKEMLHNDVLGKKAAKQTCETEGFHHKSKIKNALKFCLPSPCLEIWWKNVAEEN